MGGVAEVGFYFAAAFGEKSGNVLVFDRRADDAILAVLPIGGGGDFVVGGELKGIDHAQEFGEIAAGGGGIGERQFDFLARSDDEH